MRRAGIIGKACYEQILRDAPSAQGRVAVAMRVHDDRTVSLAKIASDEIGSARLQGCLTRLFGVPTNAAPDGNCVDVLVPLNLRPKAAHTAGDPAK